MKSPLLRPALTLAALFVCFALSAAETFRVAAYNVENYLDQPTESRPKIKSAEAKAKVRETIRAMKPDVLVLEEMGGLSALTELRDSLKARRLHYPYMEHITGYDTNIHVAVLSKFPFTARRPHTNDTFLLSGRRFTVSRGLLEVDVQVNANYSFTLLAAHLKSKRPIPDADEEDLRLEEAKVLREKVDLRLAANLNANLIVLGDFNDTYDSKSTKAIIGRGKTKLVDTRPAERNGDNQPHPTNPHYFPRNVTWTHHFGAKDSYERFDYILLSPGMANELVTGQTYIPTIPNWGIGSDHRPVLATFIAEDR